MVTVHPSMCLLQCNNSQSPISATWSYLTHQLNHLDCNTKVDALVGFVVIMLMSRGYPGCPMDHILHLIPQKVAVECLCFLIVGSLSMLEVELQCMPICWYDQPKHHKKKYWPLLHLSVSFGSGGFGSCTYWTMLEDALVPPVNIS